MKNYFSFNIKAYMEDWSKNEYIFFRCLQWFEI